MKIFLYLCLFFVCTPTLLNAQIVITEIMYDTEGSDSGHEWVEIYNNSTESVDILGWWFFDGSNHGFQNVNAILDSNTYAVIADNPEKFSADWPDTVALILDSSAFSLKNTGEKIAVLDAEKNEIDAVSYSPLPEADGQGSSLQLMDGVWVAMLPTPGRANDSYKDMASENQNISAPAAQQDSSVWVEDTKKIYIDIDGGKYRTVFVGADSLFNGQAYGFTKEPLPNARYIWNFGDGTIKEGERVLHAYMYPGEYIVFLDGVSGKYSASDRLKINAIPAEIQISNIKEGQDGFIELYNLSKEDLNLSWWRLRAEGSHYTLPENTYILPNTKVIFPAQVTGLVVTVEQDDISLLYPNGKIAVQYQLTTDSKQFAVEDLKTKISVNRQTDSEKIAVSSTVENRKEEYVEVGQNLDSLNIAFTPLDLTYELDRRLTPFSKWLTVLLAVIFLSASGIVFISSKEFQKEKKEIVVYDDMAREIKIIDQV